MKSLYFLSFVFFLNVIGLNAQEFKSVLGIPDKFNKPMDLEGVDLEAYMNKPTGPKDKKRAWKVICDRDNMETYSDPNTLEKSGKKLKFKEWYYVVNESGNYIQLIRMNGEPDLALGIPKGSYIENFGWVEKSKILLWTTAIRSQKTGIYLKSLILYTAEGAQEVIKNNNQGVKFHNGPQKHYSSAGSISLYDFYFILKKEDEYYLLSRESEFKNSANFSLDIVGWVGQNDQADWNTRLALEPNFTKEAHDERARVPSLQFTAYSVNTEAEKQHLSGNGNLNKLISKDDPVNAPKNELAKSNSRRFIGQKLRMPVLKSETSYFSTGILGSFGKTGSNNCPACEEAYKKISQFQNNYDILFVVEGTTQMRAFKDEIKNAIANMKRELTDIPNKRFAIAFYRNANVKGKSFLDVIPLTSDIELLSTKIDQAVFTEDSYDGYTSLYSALSKSTAKVGFKEDNTNIIYVIGQNPDFRESPELKLRCIDNDCDAAVKSDDLVVQLSNLRAHLVFIQPSLPKNATNNDLEEQCVDLMLEVSKRNFSSYRDINEMIPTSKDQNPSIFSGEAITTIKGGPTKSVFYAAASHFSLSNAEFSSHIRNTFKDIKTNLNIVGKELEKLLSGEEIDPEEIKGSGFEGTLIDKLKQVLIKGGLEASQENLEKLMDRKVNLYVRAFVPKRIYGGNYDLCSPVLFFPEKELGEYLNDLRMLVDLANEPEDILRTRLKETLISLYKKYSGDNKIGNDITVNDFASQLAGEGFEFKNPNHDFALNKIDNPRVKIETLRNFLDELGKKYRRLEAITKSQSFEFKFSSRSASIGKNNYYWIPFEDTF